MLGIISAALGIAKATGLDEKLGGWLFGDKGESVARDVVQLAQRVTGEQDPDAALKAIKADPTKMLELQRILNQHIVQMKKLDNEERANARAMQVAALRQADKFSKRFIYYFAALWSIFSFGYIVAITFWHIPETSIRFADTVIGFLLGTALAGMFSFFYGSNESTTASNQTQALLKEVKETPE